VLSKTPLILLLGSFIRNGLKKTFAFTDRDQEDFSIFIFKFFFFFF